METDTMTDSANPTNSSRRQFLKTGATVAGTLGLNLTMNSGAFAAGSDQLKVGLVGCGGRGTGAAQQALTADSQVKLVACADAFPQQIDNAIGSLKANKRIAEQVAVTDDYKFVGLEGYRKLIDACDVVLLASPPGFRPYHLRAAVEAGKHIFTEKPMATDAPGIRSVIESVKIAKEKNLAMVAGFCWRYDLPRRELFKRIHGGEIGDIVAAYGTYLTSPVKPMPPASTRPEGISDFDWMLRNWYNFTWLSGDGLVEQAIHTVDWLQWVAKDVPPSKCVAVGGRQIPAHGGNIFDHIEVNYEWESGLRCFIAQRQISGCHSENGLTVLGSKGTARITGFGKDGVSITGTNPWKYEGPSPDMYQVEHDEFFDSIRTGKPINDGDRMVTSTMAGIMGRMAGYTGKQVTWDMAMNSKELLCPDLKSLSDEIKVAPIAQPGVTPFI
jgi:myo-inositol 2-dehydrogenase/D-chiro-inositol 1-dehydrogenase